MIPVGFALLALQGLAEAARNALVLLQARPRPEPPREREGEEV